MYCGLCDRHTVSGKRHRGQQGGEKAYRPRALTPSRTKSRRLAEAGCEEVKEPPVASPRPRVGPSPAWVHDPLAQDSEGSYVIQGVEI